MEQFHAIPAAQAAQAASELAEEIRGAAQRFRTVMQQLADERIAAQAIVEQGYRLDLSHAALAAGAAALAAAATALQSRQGPAGAQPHLEQAEVHLHEAIASGSGAPALRAANERRLAEVEALGEAAAARIDAGAQAFDQVDEFAESTWDDISGNGSEAQAAADRAQEHWELAASANAMEEQQFLVAQQHLASATAELEFVEQLIEAIITRLRDLEAARAAAPELLAEAERSLNDALAFVRANDADVGQDPEVQMREASEQLAKATAEAQQPKPDWLRLAAAATAADRLADAALAGARDEATSMDRMRQQIAKLRPIAVAEVNKIAKYVNLHGADIQTETMAVVKTLVEQFDQAQALEQQAEKLIEDQRRTALEQAMASYVRIQAESEGVYQRAFNDVQRLEKQRAELNKLLSDARSALDGGAALARQAGRRTPANALAQINQAQARFDQIRLPITGEANLQRSIELARSISREAQAASSEIRKHIPRPTPSSSSPGSLIAGGSRSSSWTSSSSSRRSSSSSSSSSWGRGGSSGGSFGGGSRGGSFGGGSRGGKW